MGGAVSVAKKIFDPDSNNKPDKKMFVTYLNQVTSEAFMDILNECSLTVAAQEDITLGCQPDVRAYGLQEDTFVCSECYRSVLDSFQSQTTVQRVLWNRGGDVNIVKSANVQLAEVGASLEACRALCKTCEFTNISQDTFLQVNQSCSVNSQSIYNWQASVKGQVTSMLYQKTDMAAALVKATQGSNKDIVITNITNDISSRLDSRLASTLLSSLEPNQRVALSAQGSATFNGIHQYVLATQVSSTLASQKVFSNIMSDEQFDQMSNVWIQDSTLDAFGNVIEKVTVSFADIVESTVGGIMFGVLILVGLLVLVGFGLIIAKEVKKNKH